MNEQTVRELGAYLRWKRKEMTKSLDDVARETRLRVEMLRAIENGEIQVLPAPVYAKGMVKIYLEYLGAGELLPQYEEILGARRQEEPPEASFAKPAVTRGFRRRDNRWIVILLALAVVVAGYLLWQQKGVLGDAIDRKARQVTVESQVQKPELLKTSPDLSLSTGLVNEAGAGAAGSNEKSESDDLSWLPGHGAKTGGSVPAAEGRLEISASESCWILVTSEGETLFRGTLKKGETRGFPSGKDIRVRYGKPSAVTVRWLGKDLGRPSTQPKVVTVLYKADGSFSFR